MQKIEFNGLIGYYFTIAEARGLQKKDPAQLEELYNSVESPEWWTVHHTDRDWTEPDGIARGKGLCNRMGVILASGGFLPDYTDLKKKRERYKALIEVFEKGEYGEYGETK